MYRVSPLKKGKEEAQGKDLPRPQRNGDRVDASIVKGSRIQVRANHFPVSRISLCMVILRYHFAYPCTFILAGEI